MRLSEIFKKNQNVEGQYKNSLELVTFFYDLLSKEENKEIKVEAAISDDKNSFDYFDESVKLANGLIFLLSRNVTNNLVHMSIIRELSQLCFSKNQIQKKIRMSEVSNTQNLIVCHLNQHFNLINKIYLTMEEAQNNYEKYRLIFKDEMNEIQMYFKENLKIYPVNHDLSICN